MPIETNLRILNEYILKTSKINLIIDENTIFNKTHKKKVTPTNELPSF